MKKQIAELELGIDQNDLDKEWVNQPSLYYKYATDLADAKQDLEEAKSDFDVVKAELDQTIRSFPEKYGLAKLTEAGVASAIPNQDRYKTARDNIIARKHDVDILEAAVSALDHRKKALENLVSLFLANYYSSPKAPNHGRERMAEVEKNSITQRVRGALQKGE